MCEAGPVDDLRQRALLRLYAGESPDSICADLSITVDQLAEWDRNTEPEELRPAGLPYVSGTLSPPGHGFPRSNLGMRVGPPDRSANGVQRVHVIAAPTESACGRCGRGVIPEAFQLSSQSWPAFVLVEEAPEGRSVRLITEEESGLFPACEP